MRREQDPPSEDMGVKLNEEEEKIAPRLYSTPEMAQQLQQLKKENAKYPFHQQSETQVKLAEDTGLGRGAGLDEVLEALDRKWRQSLTGPITKDASEKHRKEIIDLHAKILKERGFPEGSSALDVISAEKESKGYKIRSGTWVTKEEAERIDRGVV